MATARKPAASKKPAASRKPAKKQAARPAKKIGQPSKLTPEVQDKIVQAILAGNYQETAASYAGIGRTTFFRWMEQGADPDAPQMYRDFRDAVESARAQAEVRHVALITQAAQGGTWQASAWYLERSYPQRWGRLQRTEITGRDGGPIEVDATVIERRIAEALGEL